METTNEHTRACGSVSVLVDEERRGLRSKVQFMCKMSENILFSIESKDGWFEIDELFNGFHGTRVRFRLKFDDSHFNFQGIQMVLI